MCSPPPSPSSTPATSRLMSKRRIGVWIWRRTARARRGSACASVTAVGTPRLSSWAIDGPDIASTGIASASGISAAITWLMRRSVPASSPFEAETIEGFGTGADAA